MADSIFTIRLLPDGTVRLSINGHADAWAKTRLIVTEQTDQARLVGPVCLEVPWWELAPIFSKLGSIQSLFPELKIDADTDIPMGAITHPSKAFVFKNSDLPELTFL